MGESKTVLASSSIECLDHNGGSRAQVLSGSIVAVADHDDPFPIRSITLGYVCIPIHDQGNPIICMIFVPILPYSCRMFSRKNICGMSSLGIEDHVCSSLKLHQRRRLCYEDNIHCSKCWHQFFRKQTIFKVNAPLIDLFLSDIYDGEVRDKMIPVLSNSTEL